MSFHDDAIDRGLPASDGAGLAERLREIGAELGTHELHVLVEIAERMRRGSRKYGALDLASDRRDWRNETFEELADALVYTTCGLLRGAV